MNYKDLNRELNTDNLKTSYIFTGQEIYILDSFIKAIKEKYIDQDFSDFNYIELGEESNLEDLRNAIETMPFMSDKKLIIVKDIGEFIKNNNLKNELLDFKDQIDPDTILIYRDREENLNKRIKFYQNYNKTKQVVKFEKLNKPDLFNWIVRFLNNEEYKIENREINYFIDRINYLEYRSNITLLDLIRELEKIMAASDGKTITKTDIDSVFVDRLNDSIFELLDYISKKNTKLALNQLDEMVQLGEPISRILYMINRQFRLIAKLKTFQDAGYARGDLMKKLAISNFEFNKIMANSKNFTFNELDNILKEILNIDIKQKTSSLDEKLALEMLLLKII